MSDDLTHIDKDGNAHMVDVSDKAVTKRVATVRGFVFAEPTTIQKIDSGEHKKGDVLGVARLAGIMASKRTGELIPLCHPLPIESVTVDFKIGDSWICIETTVSTSAKTGVEMEAMIGTQIAAATVYDMVKAVDKGVTIGPVFLLRKEGGKSGTFLHPDPPGPTIP